MQIKLSQIKDSKNWLKFAIPEEAKEKMFGTLYFSKELYSKPIKVTITIEEESNEANKETD